MTVALSFLEEEPQADDRDACSRFLIHHHRFTGLLLRPQRAPSSPAYTHPIAPRVCLNDLHLFILCTIWYIKRFEYTLKKQLLNVIFI